MNIFDGRTQGLERGVGPFSVPITGLGLCFSSRRKGGGGGWGGGGFY